MTEGMTNVEMVVKDGILTIKVKLDEEHGTSRSGKSTTIASSNGNKEIQGAPGVKIGLNIYKPAK